MWQYTKKVLGIYYWNFLQWLNRKVLKTYPLIEECARCRDCGRNVHDFNVTDHLWEAVMGKEEGVWCFDCFCDRADKKGIKWRMDLIKLKWYFR